MPCESTPRRLDATRQAAAISALCLGTPAPSRISSQKWVNASTARVGMSLQISPMRAVSPRRVSVGEVWNSAHSAHSMPESEALRHSKRESYMPKKTQDLRQFLVEEL